MLLQVCCRRLGRRNRLAWWSTSQTSVGDVSISLVLNWFEHRWQPGPGAIYIGTHCSRWQNTGRCRSRQDDARWFSNVPQTHKDRTCYLLKQNEKKASYLSLSWSVSAPRNSCAPDKRSSHKKPKCLNYLSCTYLTHEGLVVRSGSDNWPDSSFPVSIFLALALTVEEHQALRFYYAKTTPTKF